MYKAKKIGEKRELTQTERYDNRSNLDVLIIDHKDAGAVMTKEEGKVRIKSTDILIDSLEKKIELASFIIETAREL